MQPAVLHSHTIYVELFNRIIRREYKSGSWLREDAIASEFGVSRTPVREALSELAQDRLVETIPKRGSRIVGFGVDDLEEAYEIRRALELLALERGIGTVRIAELTSVRNEIERARETGDPAQHTAVDARLHATIIESAGSPRLESMHGSLFRIMRSFREMGFRDETIRDTTVREHIELIDAIATRDLQLAGELLGLHIRQAKARILRNVLRSGM